VLIPSVLGAANQAAISVSIDEKGKVIDYLDNYFITSVFGTITISNPSNVWVYSFLVPLELNSLTIIERSNPKYITDTNHILIPELDSQNDIVIEYAILGINPVNPVVNNKSVLYSSINMDGIRYFSKLREQLLKSEVENSSNQPNARLVSVHVDNPTDFEYIIHKLDVIKTTDLNPNVEMNKWSFPASGESNIISPHAVYVVDIYDTDAAEGEVYWMSTDIDIRTTVVYDFSDVQQNSMPDEKDFFVEAPVTVERELQELVDRSNIDLIARKTISKNVVFPDDILNVSIIVDNIGSSSQSISITDPIPDGFKIVSVDAGGSVSGDNIIWTDKRVSPKNSRWVSYSMKFVDTDAVGMMYLGSAVIKSTNKTIYTSKVPVIRKYQPKQVLYLQKRLNFKGSDEVEVTITLQNLGESDIENLLLREFLEDYDEFREISFLPREKGLWEIAKIEKGDSWSVSYVTSETAKLNTLPDVFGVEKATVTKSIMLVNTVEYNFFMQNIQWIEIFGLAVVIIVPLSYFVVIRLSGAAAPPRGGGTIQAVKTAPGVSGKLHIIKQEVKR